MWESRKATKRAEACKKSFALVTVTAGCVRACVTGTDRETVREGSTERERERVNAREAVGERVTQSILLIVVCVRVRLRVFAPHTHALYSLHRERASLEGAKNVFEFEYK